MDKRDMAHRLRWWQALDTRRMVAEHYGQVMPIRLVVCGVCDGRGEYVNPSIDSTGITGDEMAELGDDFREEYVAGLYNVGCTLCAGKRVVPSPTEGQDIATLAQYEREVYEGEQIRVSEARLCWGAEGY